MTGAWWARVARDVVRAAGRDARAFLDVLEKEPPSANSRAQNGRPSNSPTSKI